MKPSEIRALRDLEAQKEKERAQNITEDLENTSKTVSGEPRQSTKKGKSILDKDVVSMRKEGFFQSRVKTITFIACIAIFLVFGILITVIPVIRRQDKTYGEIQMTLEDAGRIALKKQYITWNDFDNFIYKDQSTRDIRQHLYIIKADGETYAIMVTGPKSDKTYPDNVIFYNTKAGSTYIDLTTDDFAEFLAGVLVTPTRYMTVADVVAVSNGKDYIKWTSFADFKYTESTEASADGTILFTVRKYQVEGTGCAVWVYGEKVVGEPYKVILQHGIDAKGSLNLKSATSKEVEDFINDHR